MTLPLDKLSPLPQSHAVCKMWSFGHASKGCALETLQEILLPCNTEAVQGTEQRKKLYDTMKTWTGGENDAQRLKSILEK